MGFTGAHMGQFPQHGTLDSKNVFVLLLAHLEPELELFEVDDIGNNCDDDLLNHYLPYFRQLLLGF